MLNISPVDFVVDEVAPVTDKKKAYHSGFVRKINVECFYLIFFLES